MEGFQNIAPSLDAKEVKRLPRYSLHWIYMAAVMYSISLKNFPRIETGVNETHPKDATKPSACPKPLKPLQEAAKHS
jgi:hypothetical protein